MYPRYRSLLLTIAVLLMLLAALQGLSNISAASPQLSTNAAVNLAVGIAPPDSRAANSISGGTTANAPAGGSVSLVGTTTLTQDLNLSSTAGVGSLNSVIGGQAFGTAGYLLFNYNGGSSFIACNPPTTACPASPNANDYNLIGGSFAGVNISITRTSGISNPMTQTQSGGSAYIDSGAHIFSGIYDAGLNGNGQSLIINLTSLPSGQFRISVYNNNNPGDGFRNGYMEVTNGSSIPYESVFYPAGGGEVTQWLVSATNSLQIIERNTSPLNSPSGESLGSRTSWTYHLPTSSTSASRLPITQDWSMATPITSTCPTTTSAATRWPRLSMRVS